MTSIPKAFRVQEYTLTMISKSALTIIETDKVAYSKMMDCAGEIDACNPLKTDIRTILKKYGMSNFYRDQPRDPLALN